MVVDLVGFRCGPMIGPHDHVPAILAGHGGCDRPSRWVKRNERAGGVEGDALDLVGSDVSGRDGSAHSAADRRPDLIRTVLGMIGLGMGGRERSVGARKQNTAHVEHPGARAARSDVHSDHKFSHAGIQMKRRCGVKWSRTSVS